MSQAVTPDLLTRRTYNILINLAMRGRTITYVALAEKLGTPTEGNGLGKALTPILETIARHCIRHNLPGITSLVVRKSGALEGLPGDGFWQLMDMGHLDVNTKRERTRTIHEDVFHYWDLSIEADEDPNPWKIVQRRRDCKVHMVLRNDQLGMAVVLRENAVTTKSIR